ncbi:Homeobox protein Hox-D3 [Larimichthys crocea]|uniref:Homeobox protein Hox-D3 n=1 Tax=Larimichthys crocea TaxID=215358 RepID=A0A6G0J6S1_LARCR|nr:Homeobox protein Hox-D3 [Larimichthys crocea]
MREGYKTNLRRFRSQTGATKATYYDNSGLFGGYTYPKPDSYNYGPAHQSYPTSNIESDYQGSVCPIQTSTVRPPTLKDSDLNGDCMRQSSSQSSSSNNNNSSSSSSSSSQATSIGEQQAPPLSASSPSSNSSASQKKKSPSSSASNSSTPALTKQIFPWMKETRQNCKAEGQQLQPHCR